LKFRWDKKYLYWGVTAFSVIACSILFYSVLAEWSSVLKILRKLNAILNPVILGIVLAYIFTPILNFFESSFLLKMGSKAFPGNERKAKTFSRVTGIIMVLLILLALLILFIAFVMPQIYYSLQKLVHKTQDYYNTIYIFLNELFNKDMGTESVLSGALFKTKEYITGWINTGLMPRAKDIIVNVSSGLLGALQSLFDLFVGVILSTYLLYRKEEFIARLKKLSYSALSKKLTDSLMNSIGHIHRTFGRYIVGKIINSVLMSLICAAFMIGFNMPYAALISLIIGVTDMIPFFGPYIGTIPCVLLVLLEDPVKAVILLAFLLILHSFNGSIMEPKIIGTSTGISGFWVLFAIFLFGGIFGVIGMLCGVPLFAVIYSAIGTWSTHRLKAKGFPTDTSKYEVQGPIAPIRDE